MDNELLASLLARCALKEQKALEKLYGLSAVYLHAVAYKIVRSQESSNEVLQDAFVQIWDNAGSFSPAQSQATTWMSSIVRYRAIDKIRREQKHANRIGGDEEEDLLLTTPAKERPLEELENIELNHKTQACLETMHEKFSKSIKLAYLYGYSREELVDILGANLNTVKSWLRRGSLKLKECLQNEYK
ncbi:RNA polymerase sigma factor [Agaribacter flavus]|uniref:RNA polymerase sigma factor n=1 Tax=Agaribacter flavus TaxID=1902781 RepID=A0ABV7FNP9_9ALTE